MYNPSPFDRVSKEEMLEIIKSNSLATIISNNVDFPIASIIPLHFRQKEKTLIGHCSNKNPHLEIFRKNKNVLVIFSGADHFISAYHKDPKNCSIIPTWNYQVVQIHGIITIMEEPELQASLTEMMTEFEKGYPKQFDPEAYDKKTYHNKIQAITGFSIEISEMAACFRLGQNRDKDIVQNIIGGLENEGKGAATEVAKQMKKFNLAKLK